MYDDDNSQYDQFDENDNTTLGNLRKADRAKAKQIKELETALAAATAEAATYRAKVDTATVAEILKAKGVNPGVSKFLADVEPTQEAIEGWLTENGKLIGYNPEEGAAVSGETEGETHQEVSEANTSLSSEMSELQAAMAKAQKAEANAAPGAIAGDAALDNIKRLGQNATSFADVEKGLKELGFMK